MSTHSPLQTAWNSQPARDPEAMKRRLRWRSGLNGSAEFVGLSVQTLVLAGVAWVAETWLCRIGAALAAVALAQAAARPLLHFLRWPKRDTAAPTATYYRAALLHQREFAARSFKRAVLPPVPGVVLGLAGWFASANGPGERLSIAGLALFWCGMQYLCTQQAREEVARLDRELQATALDVS